MFIYVTRPPPHVSLFLWKRRFFFLCFGLPSTRTREYGHRKCIFKKLSGEETWTFRLIVFVWTDENGGFRIRWSHKSYSTDSNTLRVNERFLLLLLFYFIFIFFENRKKISVFKNIRIRVDEALDIGVSSDTCGCK